jgi:hypothetical protein
MLAVRGRRRALALMVLMYVPAPFVVMGLNDDTSLVSVIPIAVACLCGTSYSWAKWRRRPEDSQSVAFVGLDRKRRVTTYRSLLRGTAIDDAVVVTIVESIDCHLRGSLWIVVASVIAVAAAAIGLVEAGGGGGWTPAAIAIGVLAAAVIAGHRWVINRVTLVLDRGRLP